MPARGSGNVRMLGEHVLQRQGRVLGATGVPGPAVLADVGQRAGDDADPARPRRPARPGHGYLVAADDPNNGSTAAVDHTDILFSSSTDNGVTWTQRAAPSVRRLAVCTRMTPAAFRRSISSGALASGTTQTRRPMTSPS